MQGGGYLGASKSSFPSKLVSSAVVETVSLLNLGPKASFKFTPTADAPLEDTVFNTFLYVSFHFGTLFCACKLGQYKYFACYVIIDNHNYLWMLDKGGV